VWLAVSSRFAEAALCQTAAFDLVATNYVAMLCVDSLPCVDSLVYVSAFVVYSSKRMLPCCDCRSVSRRLTPRVDACQLTGTL
jgi:hypothetical protein